jgi:hypothetical protein
MRWNLKKPYEILESVLKEALLQCADGKGKARHANEGEAFEDQPICEISRRVGIGFVLGQATKKVFESQRLDTDAGVKEILGAIVYLAAAVILRREKGEA